MAVKLGMQAKLYRNTGTYAAPVWNEVGNCKNVTLNLETAEADVTTRGNAGWRASVATLKDASIEFEMVWDDADDDFSAFSSAFFANTPVELAVMSGAITGDANSRGLRALCTVVNFSRSEPLEEAIMASVNLKPTYSVNPPAWISGTA